MIDISKFEVIDLEAIWESELLPLLDADAALREIHKDAMKAWSKARGVSLECLQEEHDAWSLTTSDFHETYAQAQLEKHGGELLAEYEHWLKRAFDAEGDPELEAHNWGKADAIIADFYPKITSPHYWASRHACHAYAPFAMCLAHAWKPDGAWRIATSDRHSTAVSEKDGLIFDILLWDTSAKIINSMTTGGELMTLQGMLDEALAAA